MEYESPIFGFIDDAEFWFRPGPGARVEYRSASRIGESDGNINRQVGCNLLQLTASYCKLLQAGCLAMLSFALHVLVDD